MEAPVEGVDGQTPRAICHVRHRPEHTLLYRIVAQHYPRFIEALEAKERRLPVHVRREFEEFLRCGRLEFGFLRVRCEGCRAEKLVAFSCKRRGFCPSCGARRMAESAALLVDKVLPQVPMRQWVLSVPYPLRFLFARDPRALSAALQVVYRTIATFQIRRAGYRAGQASHGAVTLIQRFGSALNLNVHFHLLMPDGVFVPQSGSSRFHGLAAPSPEELQALVECIAARIGRQLERRGILVREEGSSHLELPSGADEDALADLQGHSIVYRIALGPHQGRKALTVQTVAPEAARGSERVAQAHGFSLHAGVCARAEERDKLERLCRYISRPAVAEERLSLTAQGNIRYALKTPYRDGTTHVVFEPLDFLSRLAALVPSPRVNLTRYHGVFAPHHELRCRVVAAKEPHPPAAGQGGSRSASMSWAQRLKRVFGIEVATCERCGAQLRIIACIEDEALIQRILEHLSGARGPPETALAP